MKILELEFKKSIFDFSSQRQRQRSQTLAKFYKRGTHSGVILIVNTVKPQSMENPNEISVRDCQTQTISKAVIEFAKQAEENAANHERDPETSLTKSQIKKEREAFARDETNPGPRKAKPPPDDAPKPVDAKKIAAYAIGATAAAAVVGVGTFIAAPFVLAGLGFTTAGISAGSIGAGMMSSAAIANGGGIAAGSTVAVLQSVGAAGGLAAGTCAAFGLGSAAVGAALVAVGEVTVSAVRKIKRKAIKKPTVSVRTQTDPVDEDEL